MITEEQRQDRKNYIGGSDIAVILGLSPYKTPYQLYLEKKGHAEPEPETPYQYWGTRLEPILREEFEKRNFVSIEEPKDTKCHPLYPFLRGNLDGWIREWDEIFEAKTTLAYNRDKWGEDGSKIIPPEYIVQVAFYCSIMNCPTAHIAVLIGGNDYRELIYKRDEDLENKIIDEACKFWQSLQDNTPPNPTNVTDLKLRFPQEKSEKKLQINNEISNLLTSLSEIKDEIKYFQEMEEKTKFNVLNFMQDAEVLVDENGTYLASWKANKKGTRTFLIKGKNNE
jgi:putative phage-type endonuclease